MVVLVIHLLVCMCLVGLVLLQRSEGGALGMGGGGGGGLVSGRGAADALAKMTSVAGGFFLATSLTLTVLSGANASTDSRSVFDLLPQQQERTVPAPAEPANTTPDPTESSAPVAAETQLASLAPQLAVAAPATTTPVAPPPAAAATRAAPLEARPTPASTRPAAIQPPASRPATTPASQPATQPAAQRTTPAVTSRPPSTTPAAAQPASRPLVLPNSSGAGTGLTEPESVEVGNGVEAVRRERAGPDQ
jgi:preprotein translocase subunit SecG